MRWIIALFVSGLALCVGSTINALASGLDDVKKASLMLYNADGGFCSGTLIAPDLILSAAHCADGDGINVRVQILNEKDEVLSEKIVYVKAVRTLKGWDAALFSPKGAENFIQAFGSSVSVVDMVSDEEAKAIETEWGSTVWAVGYPKAFQLQITSGLLSGLKFLKDSIWEHQLYAISASITGGNSGGGLYVETAPKVYKLLGINVAGFRDVGFMNYATTHAAIVAVTQGFVSAEFAERAKLDKAGEGIDGK